MGADGWFLIGAPWDCSGTDRGEAHAPGALRAAGLAGLVRDDLGDAATRVGSRVRDPETGVLALADTLLAARALDAAISEALEAQPGRRPLVVGGDCSILLGILPALQRRSRPVGLWLVDGHPDAYDAHASETGETADMDLACALGIGPAPLVALADLPPMVDPRHAVLLGHRTRDLDAAAAAELARVPAEVLQIDATAVRSDPAGAGARAAAHLDATGYGAWLHVDLDVLDPEALPAVTYPQPGGVDWAGLTALTRPLARADRLLGISIADFRADLDPDGTQARRIVRLAADLLG